jgi:hypothetical protein
MPSLRDVLRAVPFIIPFFILNIYFFMAFHEAQLEAHAYKEQLDDLANDHEVQQQKQDQSTLGRKYAALQVDANDVADSLESVWSSLAEMTGQSKGDSQEDLDALLKCVSDAIKSVKEPHEMEEHRMQLAVYRAYKHMRTPRVSVLWITECGCTGIQVEALNIVYALWRKGAEVLLNVCDIPCDFELPQYLSAMLKEQAAVRLLRPDFDKEAEVVVHHYSYAGPCALKPLQPHQYAIARTMYLPLTRSVTEHHTQH